MGRRQRPSRPQPTAPASDEELDIEAFSDSLRPAGLVIRDVANDGNCFFRAVSDQLYGSEEYHNKLRQQACDYLDTNKQQYQHFVDDEQSFDDYVTDMRNDGVWADNLELQAISMTSAVNIRVHQSGKPSYDIRNHPARNAPVIHLSYHFGEHYASVRPLQTANLAVPAQHDPLPTRTGRDNGASTDPHQPASGSRRPRKTDIQSVGAVWRRAERGYNDMTALVEKTRTATNELRAQATIADYQERMRIVRAIDRDMNEAQERLEKIKDLIRDGKRTHLERTDRLRLGLKPNPSVTYDDEEEYRKSVRQRTDDIFETLNGTESMVCDATKSVVQLRTSSGTEPVRARGGKKKEQEAKRRERKERRRREQEKLARGEGNDLHAPSPSRPNELDIAI